MRLVIFSLLLVLTACGGQPAITPTPENTQGGGVSRPEDINDIEYLDFTLDVSGAETKSLTGTTRTVEAGGSRMISFAPNDFTYKTILIVRRDTQAGEHALGQPGEPISAQFAVGMGTEPNSGYRSNVAGTLTLTSIDPFSGSYEFTASNDEGKTVTAQGTFTEVPMNASLSVNGANVPPVEVYYSMSMNRSTLSMNGEENAVTVLLSFPINVPAGEYRVAAFLAESDASAEAAIAVDGEDLPQIEGRLIITDGAGERLAGSFSITASNEDGTQSVTVEGAFENVPYMG